MILNESVFKNVQTFGKNILVVTKYWERKKTLDILNEAQEEYRDVFFGLGENRIEAIKEKKLHREHVHFIGNIQSRKIPEIVEHCSTVHSLYKISHAEKIESLGIPVKVFVQIHLDPEKDIGVKPEDLGDFLSQCKAYKNIEVIGLSGMGSGVFSQEEKRKEFQTLISLRDTYLPNGLISAGTSRDYEIALEEGIDVVRVGSNSVLTN